MARETDTNILWLEATSDWWGIVRLYKTVNVSIVNWVLDIAGAPTVVNRRIAQIGKVYPYRYSCVMSRMETN